MYLDTYLIPLKVSIEFVQGMKISHYHRKSYTYSVRTNKGEFDITTSLFNALSIGDTLKVLRSSLTNVPQKACLERGDNAFTYAIGFLYGSSGLIFVPLVLLGTILVRGFYKSINNLKGRRNLTFAVFIISLIQLFFYLGF
jgi:hypothetical protein